MRVNPSGSKKTTNVIYHLTTQSVLNQILKEGLCPTYSKSSLKAIFLTDDLYTAQNYEGMKDDKCVVLQLSIDDLDPNLCGPDNYELQNWLENNSSDFNFWNQADWKYSLLKVNQFAYYGKIPASVLKIFNN